MNIFEQVKEQVTARQVAELYGVKVQRNGMACCQFHNDKNPSMKIDQTYHCFACNVGGDSIDFAARMFGISQYEAAKKLADDFRIALPKESNLKRKIRKKKEVAKRTPYQTEQKFEQWVRECIRILSDYLHLLEEWKIKYAPGNLEDGWKEEFIESCQQIEKVSYYLDILLDEELQDRIEFLLEQGKEVEKLEKRMEKYRRNNNEKTGKCVG